MISMPKIEDERTLVALSRLRVHQDMEVIKTLLKSNLDHIREKNDTAKDGQLLQQQGACQFIKNFIEQIESAPDVLQKIRLNKRRQENETRSSINR